MRGICLALGILLLPAVAGAQSTAPVSPTTPAHPAFPWALGTAIPTGQLIRDVWIPPQTIVVDTLVPAPSAPQDADAAASGTEPAATGESVAQYATLRQTVVVPGYWVRQTTAGDYYPQRWMLEQVSPGVFRWRLLAAEVRNAR